MSGIMKIIINHKKTIGTLFLLLIIIAVLLIFRMYIFAAIIITAAIVNVLAVRKMNKQKAPFWKYSKIRNVDCLVIGDISSNTAQNLSGSGTSVSIYLPGCTLAGAYEVLRHTFSILKENGGNAVLVVRKKNISKTDYSPFDINFFHPVTVNRLGLKRAKFMSRFPIVFATVKSLKFLFGTKTVSNMQDFYDEDIKNFCIERGIELQILLI